MQHEFLKFLAVVESGNFTKAAEDLHISQPALSMAISQLEKDFGHQLIIRGGSKVKLTEAGKTVYDSSRRLRLELDNLSQRLLDDEGENPQSLRLGMIDSIGDLLFSSAPEIDVKQLNLTVDDSQQLIGEVRLDRLDMAFITRQLKQTSEEMAVRSVGREPFVLVAVPKLVDGVKEQIGKNRLTDMLSYTEQSNTYGLIVSTLRGHGIKMSPSVFSTDPHLLKSLALSGRGPTLLPFRMVASELKTGVLQVIPLIFDREIKVVHRKGKYVNSAMRDVIKLVRARLQTETDECEAFTSGLSA
jgi:DNA-binding transcriptional LysR family regulator